MYPTSIRYLPLLLPLPNVHPLSRLSSCTISCPRRSSFLNMVSVRTKYAEVRRLDKTHRHLSVSSKKRSDIQQAKKKATKKHTYAERKVRKDELEEQNNLVKADLQLVRGELLDLCGTVAKKHGRTKEYWLSQIVQSERIAKTERSKSRWNAFVSMKLAQINAGMFN